MSLSTIALTAFAAYAIVVFYVFANQRSLIYFPEAGATSPGRAGVPEMLEMELLAKDGTRISAWFSPAGAGRPTMLFLHGNAGNLERCGEKLRPYLDAGLGVLAIDYRGYGKSQGKPDESGLYQDAGAGLDFLAGQGIARPILYGESLGSGVAARMAAEREISALILEAPFTSMADAGAWHYPWLPARLLTRDRFDSAARMPLIKAPILVIHGEKDRTVPVAHGRRLLELAGTNGKGLFLPEGDHVNLHELGIWRDVLEFIADKAEIGK